jgi:hypothetical protein
LGSSSWSPKDEEGVKAVLTVDINSVGEMWIGPTTSEEQQRPYVLIGEAKGAQKGDAWDII